jgi:hypothetical protein
VIGLQKRWLAFFNSSAGNYYESRIAMAAEAGVTSNSANGSNYSIRLFNHSTCAQTTDGRYTFVDSAAGFFCFVSSRLFILSNSTKVATIKMLKRITAMEVASIRSKFPILLFGFQVEINKQAQDGRRP